jgi:hypothetical protein
VPDFGLYNPKHEVLEKAPKSAGIRRQHTPSAYKLEI